LCISIEVVLFNWIILRSRFKNQRKINELFYQISNL